MEKNKLLNVLSNYNLKKIFSYTDYNFILRLIKYSKSIQNKLGITLQNYNDYISFICIKNTNVVDPSKMEKFLYSDENMFFVIILINIILYGLFLTNITIFYYISIIFELLLFNLIFQNGFILKSITNIIGIKGLFINWIFTFFPYYGIPKILTYIIKNEYNENSLKIINYVNLILILYFIFNVVYLFLIYYPKLYTYLKLKIFFSIIFILFDCLYEFAIIWRMYLIFNLKEYDKADNFYVYFLIFFNHHLIILKIRIIIFLLNTFIIIGISYYYLIEYKNIKINKYLILDNFEKLENKRNYLISKSKDFIIEHSEEELNLFSLINEFRTNNKVNKLILDKNIPDFIINESSEIMLEDIKNIFKLNKEKYLFKYKKGEFKLNFQKNEDILIKENLNRINIIIGKEIEYIIIYQIY